MNYNVQHDVCVAIAKFTKYMLTYDSAPMPNDCVFTWKKAAELRQNPKPGFTKPAIWKIDGVGRLTKMIDAT